MGPAGDGGVGGLREKVEFVWEKQVGTASLRDSK